jgi:hypothetical protein
MKLWIFEQHLEQILNCIAMQKDKMRRKETDGAIL